MDSERHARSPFNKRVVDFTSVELAMFRAGRRSARNLGISEEAAQENPYFLRGYCQERLLVRAELGELLLVRGIATICKQCETLKLYMTNDLFEPGCSCWELSEVKELAVLLRAESDGFLSVRLEYLRNKYKLRYGVLVHDRGADTARFYDVSAFHELRKETGLPVLSYPDGEPFFLAS